MFKRSIFIASFIFSASFLFAQAPKYSNEFLSIGVGARSLGMSNSNTAIVNDVTSGYWNPAGLVLVNSNIQLALMHSEYFAGIAKYDYGALSAKIDDKSAIGVSVIRFGVDDIPNTTELIDSDGNLDYNRITSFSAVDYGFLFSYSRKAKIEGLRYGANIKVIYRQVGDFGKAWGFGIDVGAQYDYKKWKFGAFGKDITSTFNAWSYNLSDKMIEAFTITGNEIPSSSTEITLPKLILAGGRNFDLGKNFNALVDLDVDLTFDGMRNVLVKSDPISIDPHLGVEFGYKDIVFLRGGVGNIQKESSMDGNKITTFQPNMGVGIKIKNNLCIDYALTDIGNASIALYSNVFSLKFNINRKEK
ncbi:MAG: PorV/PorQ family protein [Bacteroidetes bacterium]|nr:PorV/PorQ family protein [Bacteroidota bacterium]